jgi:two-component system, NarL family, response regulator DevR
MMQSVRTIKVFLLDDHEIVRRGLRELLENEEDMEVVGEAGTAEQAIDVRLPDGDGISVCREMRSTLPDLRCLMLTSFSDDEALMGAIMAGASGYLLKQVRGIELATAVRRIASGESLLDPAVTRQVLDRLRQPLNDDPLKDLTERQIGAELHLAEKTVKNYVSNLLVKLGMSRRTEAAVFATKLAQEHRRE